MSIPIPTVSGVRPERGLRPPREGKTFNSKELGQQYLEAHARHQGYAIVVKSDKGPHLQSRYFYCTCGHQKTKQPVSSSVQTILGTSNTESDSKKLRKSSTAKPGCGFGVSLNYMKKQVHWKVRIQHAHHNHNPFKRANDLPRLRRFKPQEEALIHTLKEANVRSRTIRQMLPGESAHRPMRDIYNETARARRTELGGKTPIVNLITRLQKENWFYEIKLGPNGAVESLFFCSSNCH